MFCCHFRWQHLFSNWVHLAAPEKKEGVLVSTPPLAQCSSQCWGREQLRLVNHPIILIKARKPYPVMLSPPQVAGEKWAWNQNPSLVSSGLLLSFMPPPCSSKGSAYLEHC